MSSWLMGLLLVLWTWAGFKSIASGWLFLVGRPGRSKGPLPQVVHAVDLEGAWTASEGTDWLLFVGSNLELKEGAEAALLAFAEANKLGWLSAQPGRLSLGSSESQVRDRWEQVLLPFVLGLIGAKHPTDNVDKVLSIDDEPKPRLSRSLPFADPELLLIRVEVYRATKGYDATRLSPLDNLRLAQEAAYLGYRGLYIDGREIAVDKGSASLFTKLSTLGQSLHRMMGDSLRSAVLWSLAALFMGLGPWLLFLWAPSWWGFLVLAYVVGVQSWLYVRHGFSPYWAFLAPLGALGAVSMLLYGAGFRPSISKRR